MNMKLTPIKFSIYDDGAVANSYGVAYHKPYFITANFYIFSYEQNGQFDLLGIWAHIVVIMLDQNDTKEIDILTE